MTIKHEMDAEQSHLCSDSESTLPALAENAAYKSKTPSPADPSVHSIRSSLAAMLPAVLALRVTVRHVAVDDELPRAHRV